VALLGHTSIAGAILVFSHTSPTVEAMRADMAEGLHEEGMQLTFTGPLTAFGTNGLAGAMTGFAGGGMARARGIGVVTPGGGGAYVVALTTPEAWTAGLSAAADVVARSVAARQGAGPPASSSSIVPSSAGGGQGTLLQHFAGTWKSYSKHTERTVQLRPDGTYYDLYTSSYGGSGWVAGGDSRASGRWTVQGDRSAGVMTFTDDEGATAVRYQVHQDKGQVYWNEYFFDGTLYGKQ